MDTMLRPAPSERATALIRPGTYRVRDGRLLHCRPLAGGALLLLEMDDGSEPPADRSDALPVKLSDDPEWPDGRSPRVALLAFD